MRERGRVPEARGEAPQTAGTAAAIPTPAVEGQTSEGAGAEVTDPDVAYLRAEVRMLDETIRQTIDAKRRLEGMTLERAERTNAVRVLRHMRDRSQRIADRLEGRG